MKKLSAQAKAYTFIIIAICLGVIVWKLLDLDWANLGLYLLAVLGAIAQTL